MLHSFSTTLTKQNTIPPKLSIKTLQVAKLLLFG